MEALWRKHVNASFLDGLLNRLLISHLLYNMVLWLSFIPRILLELVLLIINTPLPIVKRPIKAFSKTIHQIDLRLQQLCFWPGQYAQWCDTPQRLSAKAQAQYIGFWNTLWLIANDIIFGISMRTLFLDNFDVFAQVFAQVIKVY